MPTVIAPASDTLLAGPPAPLLDSVSEILAAMREHLEVDAVVVAGGSTGGGEEPPYVVGDTTPHGVDFQTAPRDGAQNRWLAVPLAAPGGRRLGMLYFRRRSGGSTFSGRDVDFVRVLALLITREISGRHAATEERRRAVERLAPVLFGEGLSMVFQPILRLETGQAVGFEALARFPASPPRGPDAWFREAAEIGLGAALEITAIRAALRHLRQVPSEAYMSVNVSPETVCTAAALGALDVEPPTRLAIELTEHARVTDYDLLAQRLAALRRRGVRVIVDDAGAGFASLRHILQLAPDAIKLDRSLIGGIHNDRAKRALAGSLVSFARDTGTSIIAEGIETREELDALRGLGVSHGQGFYLGRPTPLRSTEPSLSRRR